MNVTVFLCAQCPEHKDNFIDNKFQSVPLHEHVGKLCMYVISREYVIQVCEEK
jgi:hypothetical protein